MTLTEKGVLANSDALQKIASFIWQHTCATGQTPLVITSTLGPVHSLRKELHAARPADIDPSLTFLPSIMSVDHWLEETDELFQFPPVKTVLQRWEIVYEELQKYQLIQRQFGAIGEGGRWALAKSIIEACDFLTKSNIAFAFGEVSDKEAFYEKAQQAFENSLKEAYQSVEYRVAEEEGKLVLAFWKFLSNTEDPLVRQRLAYQFKINALSQSSPPPLVWIEMAKPSKTIQILQEEFLARYAQQQAVLKIGIDWHASGLWPECISGEISESIEDHRQPTQANRARYLHHQWRVLAQPSFETMAWAALECIHRHIQAGRNQIAIVAQDRLIARRIRALLARYGSGISINDQTGWTLSTTSAAAAVHSYLEILHDNEGPSLLNFMGFLKNPMLDWKVVLQTLEQHEDIDTEDFSGWIEHHLLSTSVSLGWIELRSAFSPSAKLRHQHPLHDTYCQIASQLLDRLEKIANQWQTEKLSPQEWVVKLKEDLSQFGMFSRLNEDAAGQSVLSTLDQLQMLTSSRLKLTAWVSLFDQCIEQASFIQKLPKKEIHIDIIPISGIRFRTFSAVVLVGCDDRLLPSVKDHGSMFSKEMMKQLDPDLPEAEYIQQARDLSQLLTSHEHVDLVWQVYQRAEEKNRLSRWLSRLRIDMPNLKDDKVPLTMGEAVKKVVLPSSTQIKHPALLPDALSPTAYKALRSCPYRFYVNYILKLSSPKALRDINEFGVVGTVLHDILKEFYKDYQHCQEFSSISEKTRWMEERLFQLSQSKWQELLSKDGKRIAMQEEWLSHIPEMVAWQLALESRGWSFVAAEKDFEFFLQLQTGELLKMYGRIDRMDRNPQGDFLVLDYKYKNGDKLSDLEKTIWDDPQLLIYSKAISQVHQQRDQAVKQAAWVSLRDATSNKRDHTIEVSSEKLNALDQHLLDDLNPIWMGEHMPANGITKTCGYCDARGICRKGMWHE